MWDARAGGWRNEIDEVLEGELLHAAEVGADGYDGLAGGGAFGGAFGGAEDGLGAEDEDEEDSDLEKDEDFRTYGLADADEPPNLSTFQQAAMDIPGISGPGACGDSDDDDGDGDGAAGAARASGTRTRSCGSIRERRGGGGRQARRARSAAGVRREPGALEVSAAARLYGRPGRLTSLRPDIIGGGGAGTVRQRPPPRSRSPRTAAGRSPIHGALRRQRRAGEALDEAAMAAGGGRPRGRGSGGRGRGRANGRGVAGAAGRVAVSAAAQARRRAGAVVRATQRARGSKVRPLPRIVDAWPC